MRKRRCSNPTMAVSKVDRFWEERPTPPVPSNSRNNQSSSPSNLESKDNLGPDRPAAPLPAEAEEPNLLRIPGRTTPKVAQEIRRKLRNGVCSCSCFNV